MRKVCNRCRVGTTFYKSVSQPCKECVKKRTASFARTINPDTGISNRKTWYHKHHTKNLARMSRYRNTLRDEILSHYGGGLIACVCCGEATREFLALDHVVPVGRGHNGKTKTGVPRSGLALFCWIKRMDFPDGFRVLCHNCNLGRSINAGVCPHVKELQRVFIS